MHAHQPLSECAGTLTHFCPRPLRRAEAASEAMGPKAKASVRITPEGHAYISSLETQSKRQLDPETTLQPQSRTRPRLLT
jgi:hypothetical protein